MKTFLFLFLLNEPMCFIEQFEPNRTQLPHFGPFLSSRIARVYFNAKNKLIQCTGKRLQVRNFRRLVVPNEQLRSGIPLHGEQREKGYATQLSNPVAMQQGSALEILHKGGASVQQLTCFLLIPVLFGTIHLSLSFLLLSCCRRAYYTKKWKAF